MKMEMKLNIIEPKPGKSHDEDSVSISKSTITIGVGAASKMDLKIGDYLLIATLGAQVYFAKKDANIPVSGVLISRYKNQKRVVTSNKEVQKKYPGVYKVGDFVIQKLTDVNKKEIEVAFHQLIKQ